MSALERRADRDARRAWLLDLYAETRARTETLAARLTPEDQQIQSMPDASPTKWHRAHTTWFFEAFVLAPSGVDVVDRRYGDLFNSYYEAAGPRYPRAKRGVLSRPTATEVGDYRKTVDRRTTSLIANADRDLFERVAPIVELGVAHEEQHQELLLTDILHAFFESPVRPAYRESEGDRDAATVSLPPRFVRFEGGLYEVGAGGDEFFFDNEGPRHQTWIEPFELADRPIDVAELKAFIREGGYDTPPLWLSDGLDFVRAQALARPLYTEWQDDELEVFTLTGGRIATDAEPASHLSYFEADAIARFLGARLPTELEWEVAAAAAKAEGNFVESGLLRPAPAPEGPPGTAPAQLFGDVWEWTGSSYEPYPGYETPRGALGEYNGKFMVSQRVLRGGSCLTPRRHVRATYRNFWRPGAQHQMSGARLARTVGR